METILSVGIDVGTTTTQVAFSRLVFEDTAAFSSVPSVSIVDKQVIYKSKPCFTPMQCANSIDARAVAQIVLGEYEKAGVNPRDVSAGAVIITGESARKENAASLVESLSGLAGEFVVSAAGPDLEAVIAGKGSGACAYSQEKRCRVVNLDIGGGTTNAALFDNGQTIATGCLDIGGRIVRADSDGTIRHISPSAQIIANSHGIKLHIGMKDSSALNRLCEVMADLLVQQIQLKPRTSLYYEIETENSADFDFTGDIDALCLSGGVADTAKGMNSGEDFPYGDIGVLLGRKIAMNDDLKRLPQISATDTLQATVIGAGCYTTTVSGSTISANARLLPLRNLLVVACTEQQQIKLMQGNSTELEENLKQTQNLNDSQIAIALRVFPNPTYAELKTLAQSLIEAADRAIPASSPLIVVCTADCGKALGQILKTKTRRDIISIDGITVAAHDFLDIGKPVLDGLAVPVVVKTLLFGH